MSRETVTTKNHSLTSERLIYVVTEKDDSAFIEGPPIGQALTLDGDHLDDPRRMVAGRIRLDRLL